MVHTLQFCLENTDRLEIEAMVRTIPIEQDHRSIDRSFISHIVGAPHLTRMFLIHSNDRFDALKITLHFGGLVVDVEEG